jgi:hypothetical protein
MSREPEVKKGDLVEWEGTACRVLRRRQVSGLAMFQTSEFEVKLVSLDGHDVGWVAVNEVERIADEETAS